MIEHTGPGTLKLIIADRPEALVDAATRRLRLDARRLAANAWLAFGEAPPAAIRDALADGDRPVFVAEFERWSSYGDGVDTRWLLARGH